MHVGRRIHGTQHKHATSINEMSSKYAGGRENKEENEGGVVIH